MIPDSRKLLGTYRTPRFKYGQKVLCEVRGEVTIVGTSAGKIPWPLARAGRGHPTFVVYRGLARAVRRETNAAVCHWWGITPQTVTKWRKALAVPQANEGTLRYKRAAGKSPERRHVPAAMHKTLQDPGRAAKIAAAKRGKPRPPETAAKLRVAFKGRRHTPETLAKMSAKRKCVRPPAAGVPWSEAENALLRTLPAREVARQTGRTLSAVYSQRAALKLSDARRKDVDDDLPFEVKVVGEWTDEHTKIIAELLVDLAEAEQ
jgi:hypothetical protein